MTLTQKKLPGDLETKELIEQIIRVNHAGEYGAQRIYQGQLKVLKNHPEISEMLDQEKDHLDYFDEEMKTRKVRPTVLSPLWHFGGFALGVVTAALGEKAAMACTVAVEEVIGEHYQSQLKELKDMDGETELTSKINKFKDDELAHQNIGIDFGAEQTFGYNILKNVIKNITKTAIFLSKKY